jgi:ubiquinone/menaquinone biosynthesis C-methylase UbiE
MGGLSEDEDVIACGACDARYPFVNGIPLLVSDVPAYARACVSAGQKELMELEDLQASWTEVLALRVQARTEALMPWVGAAPPVSLGRGAEYQRETTLNRMVRYIYGPYTSLREGYSEALYATLTRLGIDLPGDAKILDVGTGSGRLVAEYARIAPTGIVVGLDIAYASAVTAQRIVCSNDDYPFFYRKSGTDMPYFAQANLPGFGMTNARFLVADVQHLPLAPAQFDAIVSTNAINLTPDPRFTLDQLISLLRPGGSLIIGDLFLWRLETPLSRRCFPCREAMSDYLRQRGLTIQQELGQLPYINYWHEERQNVWRAHVISAKKLR